MLLQHVPCDKNSSLPVTGEMQQKQECRGLEPRQLLQVTRFPEYDLSTMWSGGSADGTIGGAWEKIGSIFMSVTVA